MSTRPLFPAAAQEPQGRVSLAAKLAEYFKARPGQWIDARDLLNVAGFGGWRTRISELRHAPYFMTIENRTRYGQQLTVSNVFRRITISEYRYVPDEQAMHTRQGSAA